MLEGGASGMFGVFGELRGFVSRGGGYSRRRDTLGEDERFVC